MDKSWMLEFAKIMAVLAEVYDGGTPPTKLKIEIYSKALSNTPIEEIKKAVEKMIVTRVFPSFPKPAEIIQEIRGKAEDAAAVAWIKVVDTIRRVGNYESVMFDDPIIHEVLDFMGGWPSTGEWLESELKWKQKEFERMYSILQVNSRKSIPYLPGIIEMQNSARGYKPTHQVIKIGFDNNTLIEHTASGK